MPQTKLVKLSKDQEAKFGEWVRNWNSKGLSTDPADFDSAEAAVRECYRVAGLKPPKVVLRLGSPFGVSIGGAYAVGLLEVLGKNGIQVGQQVEQQVRQQVRQQVWQQVGQQVRQQVWQQVEQQVWQQVGQQVGQQVEQQVRQQVWQQVWQQVEQQVWQQVGQQVGHSIYNYRGGQFWASWAAYVSFFRDVCGWENDTLELFKLDEELVNSCGWVWWHEDVCAISGKISELNLDGRDRLHKDGGPSIVYPDGWALYHWHGVDMPQQYIVTPADQIDIAKALSENNATVRMAVIQKCGFLRFKAQLKNKLISKTDSAELLEFDLGEMKVRGLHVKWKDKYDAPLETIIPVPRTKTQFGEDCPENINDAEQVRRWTLHMKPQESLVLET